jgi:tetratricopeptide (TPR) repeat protein
MAHAGLDEIQVAPGAENSRWHRVRLHFGIEAFGVNAWGADAGKRVIEEHTETGPAAGRHEELYFVHSGRASFTVDGEEIDAPTGSFVHVPDPESKRGAIAEEDETIVLVIGAKRGQAFSPSTWEQSAPAWDAYNKRDYVEAARLFAEVLKRNPNNPGMLYNLGCCEALIGKLEPALQHVREAAAQNERLREAAKTDPDLESIRDLLG